MKINVKPQHTDDRGEITDLLVGQSIDAITRITFSKDAVRANHYHKQTIQWTLVVSGSLLYVSSKVGQDRSQKETLLKGDLVVSEPNEAHSFRALEESEILVFTKGPRAGFDYEKDTFRLEVPLIR